MGRSHRRAQCNRSAFCETESAEERRSEPLPESCGLVGIVLFSCTVNGSIVREKFSLHVDIADTNARETRPIPTPLRLQLDWNIDL